jgi:ADP-L-glycero-D-manno-heptose 6-epimerase
MLLITGGNGLIGSNLAKALDRRSAALCVADAVPPEERPENLRGVRIREYLDRDRLLDLVTSRDPWLRRIEGVLHQGACTDTGERDLATLRRYNTDYSRSLLEWCLAARVPFLYASSAAVYGCSGCFRETAGCERPLNAYAESKLAFDRVVRETLPRARSPVVGLRYFNVYGPGEGHKGAMASMAYQLYRQVRESGVARLFGGCDGLAAGEQRRDFLHVEDAVAANVWFLERGGPSGIYNVGTGRSRSFNDLARAVVGSLGRGAIAYVPFPESLRDRYQSRTEADLGALRAAGYEAAFVDLVEGVARYLRALEAESGARARPAQAIP